jgi:hypothetical protein
MPAYPLFLILTDDHGHVTLAVRLPVLLQFSVSNWTDIGHHSSVAQNEQTTPRNKLYHWLKKMGVFWDVVPCNLAESDRRFRGAYCLYHQGGRRRENMKSHIGVLFYKLL